MEPRPALLTALVLAVASCSITTNPDAPLSHAGAITTDASAYEARSLNSVFGRYAFQVVATYRNPTDRPIYLARCYPDSPHPLFGVQLTDGSNPEGAAYDQPWACVGHDNQILVAAGATRVDTLTLGGPNLQDGITHRSLGALTGRFRIVYRPQSCVGDGACPLVADSLRYSNEFTVRLMQ